MNVFYKYRYLILRRTVQIAVMLLLAAGNYLGWGILKGDLSSTLVFGAVRLSDPYAVLQSLATGFWVGSDVLLSAFIVLAFYTLISGRMFCSWICPVNPVSDFIRWIRKRLNINRNMILLNRNIRYWLLALSLVLSAITGIAAFEAISPIGFLHREIIFGAGTGWAVVLMVVFFDFGMMKNGWCGHLCPLGAFYSVVGKAGLIKVKHRKNKCTGCNKCFMVCPEMQVLVIVGKEDGFVASGECTNCARCIEVCNDGALNFSVRLKNIRKRKE